MNLSSDKKLLNLLIFFFFSSMFLGCHAQGRYPGASFWSQLRYGGSFGIGFGNNSLNIVAAPAAVYPVSEQFAIGSNLSFNYAKFGDTKFTAYGAGILGYYNPIPSLQFSSEFEQLRVNRSFGSAFPDINENYWLPVLFLGIGYTSGPVTFGLRYDVLYDENKSLYADPWMPFIRVFF